MTETAAASRLTCTGLHVTAVHAKVLDRTEYELRNRAGERFRVFDGRGGGGPRVIATDGPIDPLSRAEEFAVGHAIGAYEKALAASRARGSRQAQTDALAHVAALAAVLLDEVDILFHAHLVERTMNIEALDGRTEGIA